MALVYLYKFARIAGNSGYGQVAEWSKAPVLAAQELFLVLRALSSTHFGFKTKVKLGQVAEWSKAPVLAAQELFLVLRALSSTHFGFKTKVK